MDRIRNLLQTEVVVKTAEKTAGDAVEDVVKCTAADMTEASVSAVGAVGAVSV